MNNFNIFMNDIYGVISQKHTLFEFILNLSFVLILVIIGTVFYWDTINRNIIKTTRCKIIVPNEDNNYNLQFFNKEKTVKLYNLSYDNSSKHNVKIDCSCPSGNVANKFSIPYYDKETEKLNNKTYKHCFCDNLYSGNENTPDNFNMEGDAFLVDYYKKIYTTYGTLADDFKSAGDYSTSLIFPN